MSSSLGWSDDRVATLSKLWLEGVSASQIARQLGGVTRNAVIGKVHRIGLSGRGAPSAPTRAPHIVTPRPRRFARPANLIRQFRATPGPTVAAAPEGPGLVDNLLHLSARTCKWPIGDPKSNGFSFCGRQSAGRYCAAHERLSRRGPARRSGRDPVVGHTLAARV